jgi:hypothetical protein
MLVSLVIQCIFNTINSNLTITLLPCLRFNYVLSNWRQKFKIIKIRFLSQEQSYEERNLA